jgi:hypothetical protein
MSSPMFTEVMSYQYQRLEDPASNIRVALLHPGSHEDEICICFRKTRLQKEEAFIQLVRKKHAYVPELEADSGRRKTPMKRYRTLGD